MLNLAEDDFKDGRHGSFDLAGSDKTITALFQKS
jgi:hypothetical protein